MHECSQESRGGVETNVSRLVSARAWVEVQGNAFPWKGPVHQLACCVMTNSSRSIMEKQNRIALSDWKADGSFGSSGTRDDVTLPVPSKKKTTLQMGSVGRLAKVAFCSALRRQERSVNLNNLKHRHVTPFESMVELSLSESYALPTRIIHRSALRLLSNATVSRNGGIKETAC